MSANAVSETGGGPKKNIGLQDNRKEPQDRHAIAANDINRLGYPEIESNPTEQKRDLEKEGNRRIIP